LCIGAGNGVDVEVMLNDVVIDSHEVPGGPSEDVILIAEQVDDLGLEGMVQPMPTCTTFSGLSSQRMTLFTSCQYLEDRWSKQSD
jgi:hypothetical protein